MSADTSAAWRLLDRDWYYLGLPADEGFAALQVVSGGSAAVPVYSDAERARALLGRAPSGVTVERLQADDLRAKEEWLRAALTAGAAELLADPAASTMEPAGTLPLRLALGYILSFRRETACL